MKNNNNESYVEKYYRLMYKRIRAENHSEELPDDFHVPSFETDKIIDYVNEGFRTNEEKVKYLYFIKRRRMAAVESDTWEKDAWRCCSNAEDFYKKINNLIKKNEEEIKIESDKNSKISKTKWLKSPYKLLGLFNKLSENFISKHYILNLNIDSKEGVYFSINGKEGPVDWKGKTSQLLFLFLILCKKNFIEENFFTNNGYAKLVSYFNVYKKDGMNLNSNTDLKKQFDKLYGNKADKWFDNNISTGNKELKRLVDEIS